jgi:hypothetical protein
LRRPSLRNVAGERHRPCLVIDRKNGAYHRRVRTIGIVNLDWKRSADPGSPFESSGPK